MADPPAALTLGPAELQARADVTYPVMEGSKRPERTDAPTRQVESVTPWR